MKNYSEQIHKKSGIKSQKSHLPISQNTFKTDLRSGAMRKMKTKFKIEVTQPICSRGRVHGAPARAAPPRSEDARRDARRQRQRPPRQIPATRAAY